MPHYIRFLKSPQVIRRSRHSDVSCVITIATDLGDSFFADQVGLSAHLVACNGSGQKRVADVDWNPTSRECAIKFRDSIFVSTNVQLHICPRENSSTRHKPAHNIPLIVEAWSGQFILTETCKAPPFMERRFRLGGDPLFRIWEATGDSIAHHIWDAALGSLHYFKDACCNDTAPLPLFHTALNGIDPAKVNVLELGSGCGIVGLALAHLWANCHVILTDLLNAGEMIQMNLALLKPALGSTVCFQMLDWDDPALPEVCKERRHDVIVVSDCTYNEDAIPSLVGTMERLAVASPDVKILVALKRRHANEAVFLTHMEQARFRILDSTRYLLPHVWSATDAAADFSEESSVVVELFLFGW